MAKRLLLILFLIFIPAGMLSAFSGWSPAVEISGGYYGAVAISDYLKSDVPIRTQASAKVYLDPLAFRIEGFQAGAAFYTQFVSPSLTYGSSRLKGFMGIGGRFFAGYFITDGYCLGLGAELGVNWFGVDVSFGNITGIIYNEFLLSRKPYVDISLLAPVDVSYRKDLIAISVSVGLKLRYKGYWIIEDDIF